MRRMQHLLAAIAFAALGSLVVMAQAPAGGQAPAGQAPAGAQQGRGGGAPAGA